MESDDEGLISVMRTTIVATILGFLLAVPAQALTLRVANGSGVALDGTTNIGGWSCKGGDIDGTLRTEVEWADAERWLDAIALRPSESLTGTAGSFETPEFAFSIPVASIECGNSAMEKDLREAMKYPSFTQIRFEYESVAELRVLRGAAGNATFQLFVNGSLTLAGQQRPIRLDVRVVRTGKRAFEATGKVRLRMTEFDVAPPVALFGLIRAHDQLDVTFNLRLRD